jgi:hypothetical protein
MAEFDTALRYDLLLVVVVVTPYGGGSNITYVVAAAPDEIPFAVRAVVASGTSVANGNIIASKLEA